MGGGRPGGRRERGLGSWSRRTRGTAGGAEHGAEGGVPDAPDEEEGAGTALSSSPEEAPGSPAHAKLKEGRY